MSPSSPTNPLVSALLTDLYQITMSYAHFQAGKHEEPCIFELFFRKNPFGGAFTILAGMDEVLNHLQSFSFTPQDIEYLKACLPYSMQMKGFGHTCRPWILPV